MWHGFTFVELPVANVYRAKLFYEDVLKFRLAHFDEHRAWCLFHIPGAATGVALYEVSAASNQPPEVSFEVPKHTVRMTAQVRDLEETLGYLTVQGVQVEPIRLHADEQFRISGFVDLDGHVWRIWQPLG